MKTLQSLIVESLNLGAEFSYDASMDKELEKVAFAINEAVNSLGKEVEAYFDKNEHKFDIRGKYVNKDGSKLQIISDFTTSLNLKFDFQKTAILLRELMLNRAYDNYNQPELVIELVFNVLKNDSILASSQTISIFVDVNSLYAEILKFSLRKFKWHKIIPTAVKEITHPKLQSANFEVFENSDIALDATTINFAELHTKQNNAALEDLVEAASLKNVKVYMNDTSFDKFTAAFKQFKSANQVSEALSNYVSYINKIFKLS